jgi:hypothetical protein
LKQVRYGKCNEAITKDRTIVLQGESIILIRRNIVVGLG